MPIEQAVLEVGLCELGADAQAEKLDGLALPAGFPRASFGFSGNRNEAHPAHQNVLPRHGFEAFGDADVLKVLARHVQPLILG